MVFTLVAMLSLSGCFKKVTTDTTLRIKPLVEETSGSKRVAAEGCFAYIYYTAKEEWTVASYEDAEAKRITNIETGEQLSEPNGEGEMWQAENSTTQYISIFQDKAPALVVVVYPEAKMYAYIYRKAEAENLHYTYLTLIFHKWKTGVYTEGSKDGYKWTVVAPETPTTPPANDENE